MSRLSRWLRFNAVGALGMALQLALLATLSRMTPRYLVATAAAVEFTLLHNFAWHVHYTWRDRSPGFSLWGRLARFHLSNGAVSLVGNLALMPLFVERLGLPVLPANGVAILICSLINFFCGDQWVFAPPAGSGMSDNLHSAP